MTDEGLTIAYVLRRWAGIQASAGRGQDAYTLQQAAITLERVAYERDRLRDALQLLYDTSDATPGTAQWEDYELAIRRAEAALKETEL